jgi:acetyl esterase/lipase
LAITEGVGIKGVWVGAAAHLITGDLKEWAAVAGVSSVRLPGYWVHKKGSSIKVASPPLPGEKIVYALHGGAYIRLSAHPKDPTANIAHGILKHVDAVQRVFSIEYRLSAGAPFKAAYPFPTALIDALTGYNYLVNVVGFSPNDIIIEGDSAGGNLTQALTRYLTEYQDSPEVKLPAPPSAIILVSPWSDVGGSHLKIVNGSASKFRNSDYIPTLDGGTTYATNAFVGPHGQEFAETSPYLSPATLHPSLHVDFKKFPRTFIVGGGAEVLIDQIRTLKDRMIKDLGEGDGVDGSEGKVRYHEVPDGIHDYLVFPWHEPERSDTLKKINKWVSA